MQAVHFRKLVSVTRSLLKNSGSTTIEFVIWIPIYLVLFMSIFEYGLMTLRYALLERAVHISAREIRIDGATGSLSPSEMISKICDATIVVSKATCEQDVRVELVPIDLRSWNPASLNANLDCTNSSSAYTPSTKSYTGIENQIVLARVCMASDAIFPSSKLNLGIRQSEQGKVVLGVSTLFSIEPVS